MPKHLSKFCPWLLFLLVLAGCGTPPPSPRETSPEPEIRSTTITVSAADLLRQANTATGATAALLRFQAAELLHEQGDRNQQHWARACITGRHTVVTR
jgi:outer membrane PBP1 activator LpoA protein